MNYRMTIREAIPGGGVEEHAPDVTASDIDYFVQVVENFYPKRTNFFAVTIVDVRTDTPVLHGARQANDLWRWSGWDYAVHPDDL